MIKLFRLAGVRRCGKATILRLLVFACLLGYLQSEPVTACRYTVHEVGFVDLRIEQYHLFGYICDETNGDIVSAFKQISYAGLVNSNIKFEIINTDQQKDHPAMKLLDLQQAKSLPAAVLVSPDGQSLPVTVTESDRPFEETLRSAFEDILSSPKREEILKQVIETYGVVLLIEGPDDQENKKAKEAASDVIELISSQMDMLPKPITHPPVLVVMDLKSVKREKILLWSLGLDSEEVSEPHAAVIYGRARWIGPLFKGEEITEDNLANVLFVIGADCECGLDHRWLQGTMLPARWTDKMQAKVAENLGFDPENPMIKMEMSMIIRRGSYSYPGVPLGYQEIAIEPNSTMEIQQSVRTPQENPVRNSIMTDKMIQKAQISNGENSPNEVEETSNSRSDPVEQILEPAPLAEVSSPLRNAIFVLVGLCALVLVFGIAILARAKRR
ncbi:MAG TPA: hypothetical protein HPP66_15160 [Planctomycetes bacterium]|nr:hypothetical protein [Planctomycetota bacterium]